MNSETKYTQGPWTVAESSFNAAIQYVHTIKTPEGNEIAVTSCNALSKAADANAALIAAAPELLEACEEFVRKCECGEARSTRSYAQMKAAIAKAKGEV